jgi:16S rRNA (uracil1498-N3)-methyltransferase
LDRHRAVIHLGNTLSQQRESPLHLVLAQALLKADKLDLVIEKTTELGVTEVLIFTSDRTIGGASENRRSRWNRIAQSAAKQCQRSAVPRVEGPVPFDAVLDRCAGGLRLLLWEGFSHSGPGIARHQLQDRAAVLAAVGPEGGFSPREVGRAAAAGFHIVGLAPRILRAETAAIAAVTLCQFFWGDLGWRSADK